MLPTLSDHPDRTALINELHARPFQPMASPGRVLHLAIKQPTGAAERDPEADRAHLRALLDRYSAAHPAPNGSHHSADLGIAQLKWERHTEFVSYTFYQNGPFEPAFDRQIMDLLPPDWLESAPGTVLAAVQLEILQFENEGDALAALHGPLTTQFVSESLAAGWVLDRNAMIAGDFRQHAGGLTRFALLEFGDTGPRRIGRVCQRLIEIEVYRSLSMLALPLARETMRDLTRIEAELNDLIGKIALDEDEAPERDLLTSLTTLSTEIEALSADSAFRFGAGRAYESIVKERIELLQEARVEGRQQFREFMLRRYDPAMRTVHAAERRLEDLATRASRAAELLRTRVNVVLEAQNQSVLESMDRRAATQLRLQATVEGFSVVAISYYAVSLAGYLLAPLGEPLGVDKAVLTAIVTLPVLIGVWFFIRRMRRRIELQATTRE
jgi:uncharacterized membrane-anchored protein